MTSVLQDWVMELPLRAQGTLLTGIRGCDLAPKVYINGDPFLEAHLSDTTERRLTAFLRYCVCNPADPREVDIPMSWFQSRLPSAWKISEVMHYPAHWALHIMHSYEVVGYMHPELYERQSALQVYHKFVTGLHLNPETKGQMLNRMTEDRIANGTVVS